MAKQTFTTGQVLTAAQMTSLQQTAMGGGSPSTKTASYVLVAADAGTVIQMNAAGSTTITVNTSLFSAGDSVQIQNIGAGVCTITAGTATVNTAGSLALSQWEGGFLYFTSASSAIFFDVVQSSGMTNPMTTAGDTIYGGASGTPTRLAIGSTGNVLTVSGGNPVWSAPSGGKVVQIVTANHSTVANNSTNTYAATGLTASITPSSASNKILIWAHIAEPRKSSAGQHNQIQLGLKRGSTYIKETLGLYTGTTLQLSVPSHIMVYEDSPNTTSSTTYAVDFLNYNNTAEVSVQYNAALFTTVASSIILMEVTP